MSFDILLWLVSKTRSKSYFDHIFVYDRPTSLNNHSTRLIDEILNNNLKGQEGHTIEIFEPAKESDIDNLFYQILKIGMTLQHSLKFF